MVFFVGVNYVYKLKKMLVIVLMLIFIISGEGCSTVQDKSFIKSNCFVNEYNEIKKEGTFFFCVTENDISFYEKNTGTLLKKTKWEKEKYTSVVTYATTCAKSNYFSIFDSYEGDACIFKNCGNRLDLIYNCPEDFDFIIPIASDGQVSYFAVEKYADSTQIMMEYFIVKISENGVEPKGDFNLEAPPKNGILVGDDLFFTSYDYSRENFSLYCWNTKDDTMKVNLVKQNLESSEVYYDGKELVVATDGSFVFGENSLDSNRARLFYFDDKVLNFFTEDADFKVHVIDCTTGKVIREYDSILGYYYDSGTVFLYSVDGVVYEVN